MKQNTHCGPLEWHKRVARLYVDAVADCERCRAYNSATGQDRLNSLYRPPSLAELIAQHDPATAAKEI